MLIGACCDLLIVHNFIHGNAVGRLDVDRCIVVMDPVNVLQDSGAR